MKNFSELISKRESCRNYDGKSVDTELLTQCVDAARLAPSACNSQPWKYYIINDETNAQKVRECMKPAGSNAFTANCPAFAVVTETHATLKKSLATTTPSQKWAQNDVGMSVAHYCLQAADLGLSTCILGMIDEEKLHKEFGISEDEKIRLIIATGYSADEAPREKKRKALEEICEVIK